MSLLVYLLLSDPALRQSKIVMSCLITSSRIFLKLPGFSPAVVSLCPCCSKLWVAVSGSSFTSAIELLLLMSCEANDASEICAEKSFAKLAIGTDSSVHLARFLELLNMCGISLSLQQMEQNVKNYNDHEQKLCRM